MLAGCGDGAGDGAGASPAPDTIAMKDFKYSPVKATVKLGAKISVSNADDAPHTLTDATGRREFTTGTIKGKKTGSIAFEKAGDFDYFCEFHPYMRGSVVVER